MKKIGIMLFVFLLAASLVLAAGEGIHEPGTGIENPELKEAGQGTGQGLTENAEIAVQQQNAGEEIQVQTQTQAQVKSGSYTDESGKQVQIQEQANNRIQLKSGEMSAQTSMQMTQEQTQAGTKLKAKLSNGQNAEIKVMPDTASEKALERLRMKVCSSENNCSIELKEVGSGEEAKAAYEVKAQKNAKVLGIFQAKMQVEAHVDAETGEVIQTKKPWWAFLASESEE